MYCEPTSRQVLSDVYVVSAYTGIDGGPFLVRGRVPKCKISESDPVVYYQAEDLYIGGRAQFYKHNFIIIDADEYALRYMEKNKEKVRNPLHEIKEMDCAQSVCSLSVPSVKYFTHYVQTERSSSFMLHQNQRCLY